MLSLSVVMGLIFIVEMNEVSSVQWNINKHSVVLCSGDGEGRRQSGCRRPADGHDRHEDGGEGLLPHTHILTFTSQVHTLSLLHF